MNVKTLLQDYNLDMNYDYVVDNVKMVVERIKAMPISDATILFWELLPLTKENVLCNENFIVGVIATEFPQHTHEVIVH